MDRTIRLLMVTALIGACSAGSGYNYIKPAKSVASIGPVVNNDGSTKSVYFFADPDSQETNQVVSQQRPIAYRQSVPYSRTTSTYSQAVPQQRRKVYSQAVQQQRPVTYSQVASQQRPVTYSQAAPQQNSITYNQVAPQQRPVTYSQVLPQQNSITYSQIAPQQRLVTYQNPAPQQVTFTTNQIAPQQLPFLTNQVVSQQSPFIYNQVAPQQQRIVYNQIAPQQLPITYSQIVPQQQPLEYINHQIVPTVKQNLKVIFVRTPGYDAYTEALLKMAKEAIQSQTIVYVLSKEPDIAELTRRFKEIQATARKMPEVRFIKYKTDDEAVQAQQAIQAQYEGLPGTSETIGTPIIGTKIGAAETETGSINYSSGGTSGTTSSLLPSSSSLSTTTTNNEEDSYSQNSPPFLPTGIDVVPGSSYLPPQQIGN